MKSLLICHSRSSPSNFLCSFIIARYLSCIICCFWANCYSLRSCIAKSFSTMLCNWNFSCRDFYSSLLRNGNIMFNCNVWIWITLVPRVSFIHGIVEVLLTYGHGNNIFKDMWRCWLRIFVEFPHVWGIERLSSLLLWYATRGSPNKDWESIKSILIVNAREYLTFTTKKLPFIDYRCWF